VFTTVIVVARSCFATNPFPHPDRRYRTRDWWFWVGGIFSRTFMTALRSSFGSVTARVPGVRDAAGRPRSSASEMLRVTRCTGPTSIPTGSRDGPILPHAKARPYGSTARG
jgi:hypothetical protein